MRLVGNYCDTYRLIIDVTLNIDGILCDCPVALEGWFGKVVGRSSSATGGVVIERWWRKRKEEKKKRGEGKKRRKRGIGGEEMNNHLFLFSTKKKEGKGEKSDRNSSVGFGISTLSFTHIDTNRHAI